VIDKTEAARLAMGTCGNGLHVYYQAPGDRLETKLYAPWKITAVAPQRSLPHGEDHAPARKPTRRRRGRDQGP
jgi:hypothetical protein